jgi:hypothetical protein
MHLFRRSNFGTSLVVNSVNRDQTAVTCSSVGSHVRGRIGLRVGSHVGHAFSGGNLGGPRPASYQCIRASGDLQRNSAVGSPPAWKGRLGAPCYIPGIANVEADALSRSRVITEWSLLSGIFRRLFLLWGTPNVDLFASAHNAVVHQYFSIHRHDHQALGLDALQHQWDFPWMYAFPPPHLILQTLAKL